MALLTNLAFFIISCLVLVASGAFVVRSLLKISAFLRLSEFVVGFIVMALSTTLPELFVGINSALSKNSALSLGNVIGSNIVNLSLIGGIAIVVAGKVVCKAKEIKKDAIYMVVLALIPIVLMYLGNSLSRVDGAILISIFVVFGVMIYAKRKIPAKEEKDSISRLSAIISTVIFVVGVIALFLSSRYVVKYGISLALGLALPPIFIGLFFVAIGTSLPELVFSVRAMKTGHSGFALGDLIGAVMVNSTLVLGITALIYPITANFFLFLSSAVFMVVTAFIFMTFIESGQGLTTTEGIALIFLYILFIIIELSLAGVVPSA